jgi:hypothetical protein
VRRPVVATLRVECSVVLELALALVLAVGLLLACASPTAPLPRRSEPLAGHQAGPSDEVASLEALAGIFYLRVSNRRFNSIATYHDPALREFFRSPEAFADYFADFVDALTWGRFRTERATSARLLGIEAEGPARYRVIVFFEGRHALPLRWWKVKMVREDLWERIEGRWWLIPGKL